MALILQLDSDGQPNKWITWEDAVIHHAKGNVTWSMGEVEMIARGGNNKLTGEQSIIKTTSIIAIKGTAAGKRRKLVPSLNNKELFRRDCNICAYCGNPFPDVKLTRDHIIPKAKGGKDTWMNAVTSCGACNNKKDDNLLSECGMVLLYAPYVPTRAEHLILKNRNILHDQMEFLLTFLPEKSRAFNIAKNYSNKI